MNEKIPKSGKNGKNMKILNNGCLYYINKIQKLLEVRKLKSSCLRIRRPQVRILPPQSGISHLILGMLRCSTGIPVISKSYSLETITLFILYEIYVRKFTAIRLHEAPG